jgi:tRNA 2-thiouridine synthesizing protein A
MSIVIGFKDRPRCLPCLAAGLGQGTKALRDGLWDQIRSRACTREAWAWAQREAALAEGSWPPWWEAAGATAFPPAFTRPQPTAGANRAALLPAATWNAGDMSCGDLVLELRLRIRKVERGQCLHLVATDPAAAADIPAWCGLVGHRLLKAEPPSFWIEA